MPSQLRREDYMIGWVCARGFELAAAQEMLDELHSVLERDISDNDENLYTLGSIGGHNVVIVCLPAGRMGNNPMAALATVGTTFKGIRFGLMVGIGGGVPSAEADIRLGDVVVSQPCQTFGGVVQYDTGTATLSGFEHIGSLNTQPAVLLNAIARARANELQGRSRRSEHVSKLNRIAKFQRDKAGPDILFKAIYDHKGSESCLLCNTNWQKTRQPRKSDEVVVHYGTIASGNPAIRNGRTRDMLSSELGGILCFDREGAGLVNSFPCLMVRGICDYADSHKNKMWQPYAAGNAAAYVKELLCVISPTEVARMQVANEVIVEQSQVLTRTQIRHPYQTLEFSTHITTATRNLITIHEGVDLEISDINTLPYKVIRRLGIGGCASVEMVQDTKTGRIFAHKLFRRYHGPNLNKFKQEIRNEIQIMRRLSFHPHIISLFATYSCNRDFGMILTPVADDGDLATYLLNILDSGNPPTAENRAVLMRAFGCLASGLAFIHQHTIRHKDIKPQNILIHQGRIIYTDFGIAFDATQQDSTTTTGRPNGFTRRYCAPEVASWANRNRKSDIFSLGCVFIEILTILEPLLHSEYSEAPAYYEIIDNLRNDLHQKRTISPHWSGLVRICINMLESDLDRRLSAEQLLIELNAFERSMVDSSLKYFCDLCSQHA